jgi:hypothetical protein
MPHTLQIYNPLPYPRGGYVTIPWQPIAKETGYSPNELKLYQDIGTPLYYQVDQIDPADPSRDTLSFFLSKSIDPGPENYSKHTGTVTIEGVKSREEKRNAPPEQVSNLELSNNQMDLRINLTPESEGGEGFWFAGSARSIRLEKLSVFGSRMEYLDSYSEFSSGHDSEKRGFQLESIQLSHTGSPSSVHQQIYLFNQPYRLVSECKGPVRTCVTIASRPFYYWPPTDEPPVKCELYRVFSLYEDRDYLFEEIFIDIKSDKNPGKTKDLELYFTACYFTYMRMEVPQVSWYEYVPDWFSITDCASLLGYGYATDVHVGSIARPHSPFHEDALKENTFSWKLHPCKAANCLHLFSAFQKDCLSSFQAQHSFHDQLSDPLKQMAKHAIGCFESRAGKAWYEFIYKPLQARMAGQGGFHAY